MHLFYAASSVVHHSIAISEFKLQSYSPETLNSGQSRRFLHLFYVTSSFVHHFIAIGEFKLELQSENAQFGSKWAILNLKFAGWTLKTIGHILFAASSFVRHFIVRKR